MRDGAAGTGSTGQMAGTTGATPRHRRGQGCGAPTQRIAHRPARIVRSAASFIAHHSSFMTHSQVSTFNRGEQIPRLFLVHRFCLNISPLLTKYASTVFFVPGLLGGPGVRRDRRDLLHS